jgi:hypothetical protein
VISSKWFIIALTVALMVITIGSAAFGWSLAKTIFTAVGPNGLELGPNEPFLTDVRFSDKEHGWMVGRDSLYRTEDSGKTWGRVLSLPPLDVNFLNDSAHLH